MENKCCYCCSDLSTSSIDPLEMRCIKCRKNEAKYNTKPTVCMYCQIPAAFVGSKCVWCSYAERKLGPPTSCSKCRKKAAFPADKDSRKRALCRSCKLKVREQKDKHKAPISLESNAEKRKMSAIVEMSKQPRVTLTNPESQRVQSDHFLTIQQYKEDILNLQKKCANKEKIILERDKKVAALNAELMHNESENKKKILEMQKHHMELVQSLHEQIRSLTKQVRTLQRSGGN